MGSSKGRGVRGRGKLKREMGGRGCGEVDAESCSYFEENPVEQLLRAAKVIKIHISEGNGGMLRRIQI